MTRLVNTQGVNMPKQDSNTLLDIACLNFTAKLILLKQGKVSKELTNEEGDKRWQQFKIETMKRKYKVGR